MALVIDKKTGKAFHLASRIRVVVPKKTKVFLDMDNTLAVFASSKEEEPLALERMYERGFFRNLPVIGNPRPVVEQLQAEGYEVFILTKTVNSPYCMTEKWEWLQEHLPSIDYQHYIPVPATDSKLAYVKMYGGAMFHILVDDYKGNLDEWKKAGGIAVKFSNSFKIHPYRTIHNLEELPKIVHMEEKAWW